MTPDQLARLTPAEREGWERCQKATRGPWDSSYTGIFVKDGCVVAEVAPTYMGYGAPHRDKLKAENEHTANFIAHARTDLPAAYVEIARLREALDKAPHYPACPVVNAYVEYGPCNCWKSALEAPHAAALPNRDNCPSFEGDDECNPYHCAKCGRQFCTYEAMAAHQRKSEPPNA